MRISLRDLRSIIREEVIDASDRFKDKKSTDFSKKLNQLMGDLPNVFAKQNEQEKVLNSLFLSLEDVPDEHVSQKRLRMQIPLAFSEDEFSDGESVFRIVLYTTTRDSWHEDLKRWAKENADELRASCIDMKEKLFQIEKNADELEWPAPWRRYSNWNSTKSAISAYCDKIRNLTK